MNYILVPDTNSLHPSKLNIYEDVAVNDDYVNEHKILVPVALILFILIVKVSEADYGVKAKVNLNESYKS